MKRFIVVAFLAMAVSAWARPTFVVTPDPIVNGYVYTFSGCGYVPNSSVYFFATEEGEHYQEFFYGTPTASDGCFVTPDAPWIWGAGGFDVQVMQKREENGRVRVLLRTSISVVE